MQQRRRTLGKGGTCPCGERDLPFGVKHLSLVPMENLKVAHKYGEGEAHSRGNWGAGFNRHAAGKWVNFKPALTLTSGRLPKPCHSPINFPPPVPFPRAFISPTHAASQHNKTHSDQCVKPCWKNRSTLKLWRESPDSERKSPTIPPLHHQGFWRKARKYSGISKPTLG